MKEEKSPRPVVALIDLGSNSVRLLVVRLNENGSHTVLTRYKQMVRLGEGVFKTGRLSEKALERTIESLRGIADICRGYDVVEMVAYATAALRDASNARVFVDRTLRETGIRFSVISGLEEARLIHLGVASGLPDAGQKIGLFADIGGGSTEVIVGQGLHFIHLDSLKMGAVRLAGLFPKSTGPRPVPPALYEEIRAYVRDSSLRSFQKLQGLHPVFMAGSSGTIVNLAAIAARLKKRQGKSAGSPRTLTLKALTETAKRLCAAPLEQRRKFPGINPERADIIVAGAAILQTLMEETGMTSLAVSNRGLLEGMLTDYLAKGAHGHPDEEGSVREQSVRQLVRACAQDEAHVQWVARLAADLFDSAGSVGLHSYGEEERGILRCAALLHDIGLFLSFSNHHAHSRYMIENSELLGLSRREVLLTAWAAFFHRKWQEPRGEGAASFNALSQEDKRLVRVLGAFLKIAEGLERSQQQTVSVARFERRGKKIYLVLAVSKPSPTELQAVESTHAAFAKLFGVDFTVAVDAGEENEHAEGKRSHPKTN